MTNATKQENVLAGKINIIKIPLNTPKYYKLGIDQDWVKALLVELNEKAEDKTPEEFLKETQLEIAVEMTKMFKKEYGEYLLIKVDLYTEYTTQCIRTLEDMKESLELAFQFCLVDKKMEDEEEFTERLDIFEKDEMYDLYFYEKGFGELAEIIHEQIYLNINQYPIKDAETPLAWGNDSSETKQ